MLDSREAIRSFICDQFLTLFKADTLTSCHYLLNLLQSCISMSENDSLLAIPSQSEIIQVLSSFNPSKSPGPDDITTSFFKTFWHIVGHDVTQVIQNIFISGQVPKAINQTLVILIP